MTTQTIDRAIGEYVGRCVEHLRDLAESERDSILDDIRQILSEVTAELDGGPDDLLGPPARFVAELRAAAGDPSRPGEPAKRPTRFDSLANLSRRLVEASRVTVGWAAGWASVRHLATELRPAWWVLRGFLVTAAMAIWTSSDPWPRHGIRFPAVFDSQVAGLLTLGVATIGSTRIGRQHRGWKRWAGLGLTAVGLWGLLLTANYSGTYVEPTLVEIGESPATSISYYSEQTIDGFGFPVDPAEPLTVMGIGSPWTGEIIVVGPQGAEEVVAMFLAQGIPIGEIWVDFGGGGVRFTSETQLSDVVAAFWSPSG